MRNTIILTAILFISVIAATIYYFKNLDNEQGNSSSALRFLPQNTLLVAAISTDEKSSSIFKDFEIFDAVLGYDNIKIWSRLKTDILRNEKLKTFTQESNIYISFHPEGKTITSLFTIPLSQAIPSTELSGIFNEISKKYKTSTIDTLGQKVLQIKYGEKDSIINAFYFKDILFATPTISLIPKIVDKHSKHLSNEQIQFFIDNNTQNTPLSIYFPHQQYDSLVNLTMRSKDGPFINLFKKLHGQSAWNINFQEDALVLTGESQLDQYPENYASLFKNQQKTKQDLHQYFPSNTAIYTEFSLSNRATFQKDLYNLFKRRKEKIVDQIDTTKTTELVNKALGNQFAFLETNGQNYIGFVNIQDSLAFKDLAALAFDSAKDSISRFKTDKTGILYKQYGDIFKELNRPYLTVIDSILIVANNMSTLQEYRKDYLENDLLTGTLGFIKLEKLQAKEANISIFTHTKNANSKILNTLNKPFKDTYQDKDGFGYQDFFSWSIQLSGNNGNISSQIYAIYKSKNTLGINPEWSIKIGNKAITRPYVFNQSDTSQFIAIQQLDHTLHAISPTGTELWTKVLAGRVVGDILQLEDRSIVLVTDKHNLYKFDVNGKTLKGFPINIKIEPTDSPFITSINNQQAILIPTKNKVIAYDLNGKEIQNWNPFETNGNITTNIINQDKNYIIGTSEGYIYWLNEKGQKIEELKLPNSGVKTLSLVNDYKIAAVDNKGTINLFTTNSDKKTWKISNDSTQYLTAFANISNNHQKNLVVLDNNQLKVYDITDTLTTVFEHNFTKSITDDLQFFNSETEKNISLLGISSKATNLLYLFDKSGQMVSGFPVEGQPLFYYGKINFNSATYLLCMRRDHKLYAFRQQK